MCAQNGMRTEMTFTVVVDARKCHLYNNPVKTSTCGQLRAWLGISRGANECRDVERGKAATTHTRTEGESKCKRQHVRRVQRSLCVVGLMLKVGLSLLASMPWGFVAIVLRDRSSTKHHCLHAFPYLSISMYHPIISLASNMSLTDIQLIHTLLFLLVCTPF